MSYRVTKADLERELVRACGIMGKSTEPMTKDSEGKWVWNLRAWSLDHNSHYGGIRIEEVTNDAGATREVTSRMSNKEMATFIRGLILGLTYKPKESSDA